MKPEPLNKAPSPTSMSILDEAQSIITGPRREAYGPVQSSFENLAVMWSSILGHHVSPTKVALCLIALKLMREAHAHSRDNLVDIAGYAALVEQLA